MNTPFSYQAICAKCHAMSGKMLVLDDYKNLSRMTSVREIAAYLTEHTTYGNELAGVDLSNISRSTLEQLLNENLYHNYRKLLLFAYGDMKDLFKVLIKMFEIELIIKAVFEIYSENADTVFDLSSTERDILEKSDNRAAIEALLKAKNLDEALAALKDTEYYASLNAATLQNVLNLTLFEVSIYDEYYERLYRLFDKKGDRFGNKINIVGILADSKNLSRILRFKLNFNTHPEQIYPYLLDLYGKIKKRNLVDLCRMTSSEFILYLKNSKYGKSFSEEGIRNPSDYIADFTSRYYKRVFAGSSASFEVPFAFLLLKEFEVKNLIHITEGVRYHIPSDVILYNIISV